MEKDPALLVASDLSEIRKSLAEAKELIDLALNVMDRIDPKKQIPLPGLLINDIYNRIALARVNQFRIVAVNSVMGNPFSQKMKAKTYKLLLKMIRG